MNDENPEIQALSDDAKQLLDRLATEFGRSLLEAVERIVGEELERLEKKRGD